MNLELRPEQAEIIAKVSAAFRAGHKRVMVAACCGFGKCLGRGTRVLMADGSLRKVEDVVAGDRLASPTGGVRTVLSLGRGREEMFRIEPMKGDAFTCNASHLLPLTPQVNTTARLADGRTVRSGEIVAVDVSTYIQSSETARKLLKLWRPDAVDFEPEVDDDHLPVPPYIVGIYLGDGGIGLDQTPRVTKPSGTRLIEAWSEWGKSLGLRPSAYQHNDRCPTVMLYGSKGHKNAAASLLDKVGLRERRRIPSMYMRASRAVRLEVLAGLLDSDGFHVKGCFEWVTKHEAMAEDFATLARSLGFACYVSECVKTIRSSGFSGTYWRVTVSGDCERIPCRDKPAVKRSINKRHLVTGIRSVTSLGQGDYYGFELDGDHLFLLADFTVQHNTEVATAMLQATRDNGKRGAFLADRRALVEQTSERFDKYDLPHGVLMADHWRFRPAEGVQIFSVQTMLRRGCPTDLNVIFIDEAHQMSSAVRKLLEEKRCYAVGLSATPITPGLGNYFDVVVNGPTTNQMIDMGRLVPLKIHSFDQPDMQGVDRNREGEYTGKKAEERVLQVVGDVVQKYIADGANRKFICFAWSIAHAEELARQFIAAGVNVATYTADDRPEDRHESVQMFKGADSPIRGLISVAALTRGFDQTDIELLIDARPLRKAVHEYVQMLGRVMRSHPGKKSATVYDHSGNAVTFWHQWNHLFEHGVTELDGGKPKKDASPQEKKELEPATCPQCKSVHRPAPFCPSCGFEYPKRNLIETVPGTLKEILATKDLDLMRKSIWPGICWYVRHERRASDDAQGQRMAQAIYIRMTGEPAMARYERTQADSCPADLLKKLRGEQQRYLISRRHAQAKGRAKANQGEAKA